MAKRLNTRFCFEFKFFEDEAVMLPALSVLIE
jgi:hypothetical protein